MTETYHITKRYTREADAETILAEIHETRFIARFEQDDLDRLIAQDAIRFFYDDDRIAGFGAWLAINAEWVEAGPFYVTKTYRGVGLGRQLLHTVTEYNLSLGRKIMGITINPAMKHTFEREGYRHVSPGELPLAVHLHLLKKLTPGRLLSMLKNANMRDSVAHYVKG